MIQTINSSKNKVEIGPLGHSNFQTILNKSFPKSKKVIIVDENTQEHCLPYLITAFDGLSEAEIIVLPQGESNKVIEVCHQVWEAFSNYGIQRGDLIINLGGGVVTDMGGFIASIYKRGVRFINIPTTLLAMVDASVGGKTGVNLGVYKNQIGAFSFPEITFCDPVFLGTLPKRELVSGKAEMLKHAVINSKIHWSSLIDINLTKITPAILAESVQIKATLVDLDPEEKDVRKSLNFGHTVGHALEGYLMEENEYTHGDCVAWGMLVESYISFYRNQLKEEELKEIESEIRKTFPPMNIDESDFKSLISLMKNDKKNNSSQINCTLPTNIGAVLIDQQVDENIISRALLTVFKKD